MNQPMGKHLQIPQSHVVGPGKPKVGHSQSKNNATAQDLFGPMNHKHQLAQQMSDLSAGLPNANQVVQGPNPTQVNGGMPPEMQKGIKKGPPESKGGTKGNKVAPKGKKPKNAKGGSVAEADPKSIKKLSDGMGLNELFSNEDRMAMAGA